MKISILVAMLSTGLLAQQDTNMPAPMTPPDSSAAPVPATPASAVPEAQPGAQAPAPTNAPAKKSTKKKPSRNPRAKAAKKTSAPAAELKTMPLASGPALVTAHHVNVRGRAGLIGELITHLTNGEPVNVIEEIHLKHSGPEEPSAWAKITLPSDANVWVKASYIDPTNKTVLAKKLNLRAGPSELYPILGTLERGDAVSEIETKADWMKIQAPTNAFAFVAAEYLTQEPAALAAANPVPPAPAPETNAPATPPTTVVETPAVAPAPIETPAPPAMPAEMAPAVTNEVAPATPTVEETPAPPPPRIVEHEGIVRHTFSIQSPTKYELISPDTHQPINYLYTTSTNLDLSRYKGLHIIVTGQEGLDERWKNTPVLTIQKIQVLD